MDRKIIFFIIGIISLLVFQCSEKSDEDIIKTNIIQGNFEKAQKLMIDLIVANQDSISPEFIDSMKFEIERLDKAKLLGIENNRR